MSESEALNPSFRRVHCEHPETWVPVARPRPGLRAAWALNSGLAQENIGDVLVGSQSEARIGGGLRTSLLSNHT